MRQSTTYGSCADQFFLDIVSKMVHSSSFGEAQLNTPSAKVNWENVVCKGVPKLIHPRSMTETGMIRATLQSAARSSQVGQLLCCSGSGSRVN
jgi:hypothetical protein